MHDRRLFRQAALAQPIDDARLVEIVGRHLELHPVPAGQPDETLAHFAGDVGEDFVFVRELHLEHRAREDGDDFAFEFDGLVAINDGGIALGQLYYTHHFIMKEY